MMLHQLPSYRGSDPLYHSSCAESSFNRLELPSRPALSKTSSTTVQQVHPLGHKSLAALIFFLSKTWFLSACVSFESGRFPPPATVGPLGTSSTPFSLLSCSNGSVLAFRVLPLARFWSGCLEQSLHSLQSRSLS